MPIRGIILVFMIVLATVAYRFKNDENNENK